MDCGEVWLTLFHDSAVGVEQWQLLQIEDVFPVLGVALGQDGHAAYDVASCLFHQGLQGGQRLAGGDDVVHDEDPLAGP